MSAPVSINHNDINLANFKACR
ncbi:hypothetical protein XFF6991_30043 [Xanthomonas phaseoli pv. phaseoli]|uniref:Uncharacterized protein n=1 Tax=Xanthomonas campestris pv. phaseoli TaxID=317013 RepID=A0A7Z7J0S3_XANCH|nr:hypothetical protein XFF6991_30043 [Xanthomonas phaseoli pv. phaseoli]